MKDIEHYILFGKDNAITRKQLCAAAQARVDEVMAQVRLFDPKDERLGMFQQTI